MSNKNIVLLNNFNITISVFAFFYQLYTLITDNLDFQKMSFILLFGALTILTLIGQKRYFIPFFLLGSFFAIVALRLSYLSWLPMAVWLYFFILIAQFLIFVLYCEQDLALLNDKVGIKEKLMM